MTALDDADRDRSLQAQPGVDQVRQTSIDAVDQDQVAALAVEAEPQRAIEFEYDQTPRGYAAPPTPPGPSQRWTQ